jgi:hypothetical protein
MKKTIIVVASLGFLGLAGYFIYKKVKSSQPPKPSTGSNLPPKDPANKIIGHTPDGRAIYAKPSNGKPERTIYKELGYDAEGNPIDFSDLANPYDQTNQPLD